MIPTDFHDHYWIVAGSTTQVYSSARATFVPVGDATFIAWLALGRTVTKIATELELWDVLAKQFPAGIASENAIGQEVRKETEFDAVAKAGFEIAFSHENRIRTLAGQQAVTKAQFKTFVKGLL